MTRRFSRQAAVIVADAKIAIAKDRVARIERGDSVDGGFEEPIDAVKILKANGWTAADIKRARLLHEISEVGGEEASEAVLDEMMRLGKLGERKAIRTIARRLKLG